MIDDQRAESLVIDQAADGRIWATWVQQAGVGGAYRVFYSHTNGDCSSAAQCNFTPRDPVPGAGASPVAADDISSLIRFGGDIGIMWSDQVASAFKFVVASPPASFGSVETAISGPQQADDHLNLKADGSNIYAVTKTKFDSKTRRNPQTRLLVRDGSGNWTARTVSFSPDQRTRPIVLLDTQNDVIHVFETGLHPSGPNPDVGGSIYESTSDLNSIDFSVLLRRPVIQDDSSAGMNNVTSTKQNLDGTTDLAVLATNGLTKRYWHHFEQIADIPPPPPGPCDINGGPRAEIISGTSASETICGGGGNDLIRGFGGNDIIRGGTGNDTLVGGPGGDRLFGQAGSDGLIGGAGNDLAAGSFGNDRLVGGPGRDRLNGWAGRDRLIGGPSVDAFQGGAGNDTLFSRDRSRETVKGGGGRDRARINATDIRRSIEVLF
jgi:RTX calcium-binding nonapeptide repeat (4 copies)